MIIRILKYPVRVIRRKWKAWNNYRFVSARAKMAHQETRFEFDEYSDRTIKFIESLKTDHSGVRFRYSHSCNKPTLYASSYACQTFSLLGRLNLHSPNVRNSWVEYFNSFQREKDGLFYDEAVRNEHYDNSDWWGARHLAVHMMSAYTQLGARPRHPFRFLQPYYDLPYLERFLIDNNQAFEGDMNNDFDNKLMNLYSAMQYQRDFWGDQQAGRCAEFLQRYLLRKLNTQTGIWGDADITDASLRSRKVQFAYHLFPLYWYDNIYSFDVNKIKDVTLATQNKFGGYGVQPNSSACDDIDSVDILVRFSAFSKKQDERVQASLRRGMHWNLLNQVADGGFVFRLNEQFTYGHEELSSLANQGAIFPTWFRTLNMAYLCNGLNIPAPFNITRCPGYEF